MSILKTLMKILNNVSNHMPTSICVQVLAVDISIWLNQAVRGMRDKSGHAVPHAHLVFTSFLLLFF